MRAATMNALLLMAGCATPGVRDTRLADLMADRECELAALRAEAAGNAAMARGAPAEALRQYDTIKDALVPCFKSPSPSAYYNRALALRALERWDEAWGAFCIAFSEHHYRRRGTPDYEAGPSLRRVVAAVAPVCANLGPGASDRALCNGCVYATATATATAEPFPPWHEPNTCVERASP